MPGAGCLIMLEELLKAVMSLLLNSPEKYSALTGVRVLTGREAVSLDSAYRTVTARNLISGESENYTYDELIITVGASAVLPPIDGITLPGLLKCVPRMMRWNFVHI